jgi:hypothetical protein
VTNDIFSDNAMSSTFFGTFLDVRNVQTKG